MSKSDLLCALALLQGYVVDERRRRRSAYLKEGDSDEQYARRALARELRSAAPLDRQLRTAFADLVDPDAPAWEQRTIRLVARGLGRLSDHVMRTQVAEYIWSERQSGRRLADVINDAVEIFALSDEMIKKIWSGYRPRLEQVYRLPLAPDEPG
jgi:hypothetical protein